jgi:hypothetical protein
MKKGVWLTAHPSACVRACEYKLLNFEKSSDSHEMSREIYAMKSIPKL